MCATMQCAPAFQRRVVRHSQIFLPGVGAIIRSVVCSAQLSCSCGHHRSLPTAGVLSTKTDTLIGSKNEV